MTHSDIDAARDRRDASKARLRGTALAIGGRLRPRRLVEDARERAGIVADRAIATARRPKVMTGLIAGVSAMLLARHWSKRRARSADDTGATQARRDGFTQDSAVRAEKGMEA